MGEAVSPSNEIWVSFSQVHREWVIQRKEEKQERGAFHMSYREKEIVKSVHCIKSDEHIVES